MAYHIRYGSDVINHDIPSLDASVAERVRDAIETKLTIHPERFGKPLRRTLHGTRSLRVGDWRIIYAVQKLEVIVIAVQHRSKAYRGISIE